MTSATDFFASGSPAAESDFARFSYHNLPLITQREFTAWKGAWKEVTGVLFVLFWGLSFQAGVDSLPSKGYCCKVGRL